MRTTARLAAAALSTTLVVGATATSAFAQTATIKDKSSDVVRYANSADARGTQLSSSDSVSSGVDVKSLRVKHTKKSVSVNVRFRNLAPTTTIFVSFRIDGSSKPSRFLLDTTDTKGVVLNARGDVRCTVPATHRYGGNGTVNVVIKRSCLGTPKRIKASAFAAEPGFLEDSAPFSADAVSATKVRGESWTKWLKAS